LNGVEPVNTFQRLSTPANALAADVAPARRSERLHEHPGDAVSVGVQIAAVSLGGTFSRQLHRAVVGRSPRFLVERTRERALSDFLTLFSFSASVINQ
jgi:hypothetical protein